MLSTSHEHNIDELHLVQNPSVDQVQQSVVQEDESLPVTGMQQIGLNTATLNVNSGADDLLDQEDDVQVQDPPLRRGLTHDSANISNNNRESTASFAETTSNNLGAGGTGAGLLGLNSNPFARSNTGGSFLSSRVGQRAREGAFGGMETLQPLNPFSRASNAPASGAQNAANDILDDDDDDNLVSNTATNLAVTR